jgi:hypothetical protein
VPALFSVCVIGGLIAWHLALKTKTFIYTNIVYMCKAKVMLVDASRDSSVKYQKFHLNHRIKGPQKGAFNKTEKFYE